MKKNWKNSLNEQREILFQSLSKPLKLISRDCAKAWSERQKLNQVLLSGFTSIPNCTYAYVLNTEGLQICDNVSKEGLIEEHFGRNRADRPYMKEVVPAEGFLLSDAYISMRANRPSLTALQIIKKDNEVLGFLGADFDLRDLPTTNRLYPESEDWQQIKGDPSIRSQVFQQSRVDSVMDQNIDIAFAILEELFTQRGAFQTVIHFSSSRATIWVMDDPYRYRILDQEALSDTDICLVYPSHAYPQDALIPETAMATILNNLKNLRMADETIYLRSASINIFNGMISLTFSCDGTHYMYYKEFIETDDSFWG